MRDPHVYSWIKAGIVAGVAASVLYPVLLFVLLPLSATATVAAALGPAIGIASVGLFHMLGLQQRTVSAAAAAGANAIAGALFTAMALVQLAAKDMSQRSAIEPGTIAVWLGLDVAWDVYIGLGTVLFAWAMLDHPRFRWPFGLPGFVVGFLVIVLNLFTFPTPPAEAGLVDVGPLVGAWYLAITIQTWRSLGWARETLQ
jgi:hypothetical protein